MDYLRYFLEPKAVAIVGASATPKKPGYMMLENLIRWGFNGKIYPVNPSGGGILGIKTYKSLKDVPEDVELVASLAPAKDTMKIIEQAGDKEVKGIVLVSSGFSGAGKEGSRIERDVVDMAHKNGMRIIGPNAIGPINTSNDFVLSFYPIESLKKGHVAFIAQSGQFVAPLMEFIFSFLHVGMSKSFDLGNKCDIEEADVLEYLENDPDTKIIAVHCEGIKKGRRFLKVCKRVSEKKPIIVFKTGKTLVGAKAAVSHSGAISVDDTVFSAALRQAGAIRASDLDEFLDLIKVFDYLPLPKGKNIGIATYSGGIGVILADACVEYGLSVANFSEETISKIKTVLPQATEVSNPLDFFSVAPPQDIDNLYQTTIRALVKDKNINIVILCIMLPEQNVWIPDPHLIVDAASDTTKPIIVLSIGHWERIRNISNVLEDGGIPVFLSPERAVKAISALYRYSNRVFSVEKSNPAPGNNLPFQSIRN